MRVHIEMEPDEVREILKRAICNHHNIDADKASILAEGDYPYVSVTLNHDILEDVQ